MIEEFRVPIGDRLTLQLINNSLLNKMVARIHKIVSEEDDNVRVYTLCASCEKVIKIIGQGKITKTENIYVV